MGNGILKIKFGNLEILEIFGNVILKNKFGILEIFGNGILKIKFGILDIFGNGNFKITSLEL